MVLVAFFLSLAMEPAVDHLARRGWRRGSATGLVLGGVLVFTLVFLAAAGSIVVGQASDLVDHAPRYVRDFERFVNDDLGIEWNADSLVRELRSGSGALSSNDEIVSNAFDVALAVGRGAARVRHRADLRVLHDRRRPAHAPRHLLAASTRPGRRSCSTRGRSPSTRRAATSTHAASRPSISAVVTWAVPLRARRAVLAGARAVGRRSSRSSSRRSARTSRWCCPVLVAFKESPADSAVGARVPRAVPAVRELHPRAPGHQALHGRAPGARDRHRVRGRAAARRRRRDPRAPGDRGDPGGHLGLHDRARDHRRTPPRRAAANASYRSDSGSGSGAAANPSPARTEPGQPLGRSGSWCCFHGCSLG